MRLRTSSPICSICISPPRPPCIAREAASIAWFKRWISSVSTFSCGIPFPLVSVGAGVTGATRSSCRVLGQCLQLIASVTIAPFPERIRDPFQLDSKQPPLERDIRLRLDRYRYVEFAIERPARNFRMRTMTDTRIGPPHAGDHDRAAGEFDVEIAPIDAGHRDFDDDPFLAAERIERGCERKRRDQL